MGPSKLPNDKGPGGKTTKGLCQGARGASVRLKSDRFSLHKDRRVNRLESRIDFAPSEGATGYLQSSRGET